MKNVHLLAFMVLWSSTAAVAEITFYEQEGHRGRSFTVTDQIRNMDRHGFNDKASSVYVGRGRWEVCTDAFFKGDCKVLRRGSYDSLRSIGLNNKISSVREVKRDGGADMAPAGQRPSYEYHRRPNEAVFEARVISVRQVFGQAERRCWTEYEPSSGSSGSSGSNAGAAVIGAIIGGVLAHQVGKGRGNDAATAAGAVAGAAIGARSGSKDYDNTYQREVQRCSNVDSGRPAYWDVLYEFDGQEYHAQMSGPPGRTILVNQRGEPRQ